jgi:iron(III) transport system ATP-binding protein
MAELKIARLKKTFGSGKTAKVVLPDLSLDVADGAFVALLGPSGCGKTTLLRMIAGLDRPDSGAIAIGKDVVVNGKTFVPPEKRRLGMVFQTYAVWPHLNVRDNIAYPLKVQGLPAPERAKRVADVLQLVHMTELAHRFPNELSGGQQQRVALARGLAQNPRILLLDEPLSNLDARLRAELRREIRDLHRRLKLTIVYVTHDQREAFEMATDVVVMNEGRIAQRGTPEAVRQKPAAGFVAEFLAQH